MKNWKQLEKKYDDLLDHCLGLQLIEGLPIVTSREESKKLQQEFWEKIVMDAYREGYEDCLNEQANV